MPAKVKNKTRSPNPIQSAFDALRPDLFAAQTRLDIGR
jgi:hypothetical protein